MDSRTLKRLTDVRETNPKWKNTGQTSTKHTDINPGPEATPYDQARHEKMSLRTKTYGTVKVTVNGFREPKPVCDGCGRLKVWCSCI